MSIKSKLAEARVRLQEERLKKSGLNKYAGYEYYELGDFLPTINRLGKELGFVCLVSFGETATLEIVDTEKDEKLVFTSPMSTASLKGCHDVQNLGAVQTYLKRYLYQHAFEIVESDALDSTTQAPKTSNAPKPSESQKRCTELGDKLGITPAERKRLYEESERSFDKLQTLLEAMEAEKNMEIF